MNEKRKLYYLHPGMRGVEITEDLRCRLYPSLVMCGTTKEKKRTYMSKIGQAILCLILSVGMTIGVYLLLKPWVYVQRGYEAYGGECLLAVLAGIVIFRILRGY